MQQTSKYQFNLVDGTDDFSPTPLNQNMEKVEEQFETVEETLTQLASSLGTGGKTARLAFGSYTGNGKWGASNPNSLTFDFIPVLIIVRGNGLRYTGSFVRGCSSGGCCASDSSMSAVTWTEHSLSWYGEDSPDYQNNRDNVEYFYAVLGYDE